MLEFFFLKIKSRLTQGSQTRGPRHHKKLQTMAEITVLGAVKAPSTLY